FVVFSGSNIRASSAPSIPPHAADLREELRDAGVLVSNGDGPLELQKDYLFKSPSTAASVVLGISANGRTAWRDSAGRTLKELQAAEVTAPDSATAPRDT